MIVRSNGMCIDCPHALARHPIRRLPRRQIRTDREGCAAQGAISWQARNRSA